MRIYCSMLLLFFGDMERCVEDGVPIDVEAMEVAGQTKQGPREGAALSD